MCVCITRRSLESVDGTRRDVAWCLKRRGLQRCLRELKPCCHTWRHFCSTARQAAHVAVLRRLVVHLEGVGGLVKDLHPPVKGSDDHCRQQCRSDGVKVVPGSVQRRNAQEKAEEDMFSNLLNATYAWLRQSTDRGVKGGPFRVCDLLRVES